MVTILLYGVTLRQSVEEPELQLEVAAPMALEALLEANQDKLAPVLAFAKKGEILVTINKKVGALESIVKDGDTVKLTHQFNPVYEGATWQNP